MVPLLAKRGVNVCDCLTDKFPNSDAVAQSRRLRDQTVRYHPEPVDATRVPEELTGFRTMFSAFHHFRPELNKGVSPDY